MKSLEWLENPTNSFVGVSMLPHQVYKKDLTELWKKHELGEYGEIVAIPVRSEEYTTIAKCKK
jgi:hypothetical protein